MECARGRATLQVVASCTTQEGVAWRVDGFDSLFPLLVRVTPALIIHSNYFSHAQCRRP